MAATSPPCTLCSCKEQSRKLISQCFHTEKKEASEGRETYCPGDTGEGVFPGGRGQLTCIVFYQWLRQSLPLQAIVWEPEDGQDEVFVIVANVHVKTGAAANDYFIID